MEHILVPIINLLNRKKIANKEKAAVKHPITVIHSKKSDPDSNQIIKIYKVLNFFFISFWFSYISQTSEKINFNPLRLLLLIAIGVFHVDTDFEWFNDSNRPCWYQLEH